MKKLLPWLTVLALGGAMLAAPAAMAQGPAAPLKGEVLEVQNVSGYTYLRLKTAAGESWAAVPTAAVKPGASVVIVNTMVMQNFQSKTLNRQFDRIVFGALDDGKAGAAHAAPGSMAMRPTAPAAPAVTKLAKATGPEGRSVAEVVQGRSTLKDKTVQVRGQVVKVNAGIMGKNWLHLQDGSGTAQEGSNDVLVTTTELAKVGDVVQVRGTVRTDVTLGPGYQYAVLIEGASLRK
jgi:DNA/RNA endonuclease YhcR with UshA esterase domain